MVPRFIVSTGRCGSTMLSTLLGRHPEVAALSEVFATLYPRGFPAATIDGEAFWTILSEPDELWTAALMRGHEPPEFRYPLANDSRFDRRSGVPPIAAICLPSLSDDPDGVYAQLESFVRSLPSREPDIL